MSKPCKCLPIAGYRNVYPDGVFSMRFDSREDCNKWAITGRIGIQTLYAGEIESVVSKEVDALEGNENEI